MSKMEKRDIAAFFDRCAPSWDEGLIRNDGVIEKILDNAGVGPGTQVLDVACGTGVLFPDYQRRQVASLTAIDISEAMARIAQEKFPWAQVLAGDVEDRDFARQFDVVMVYNAFPHFPDPARLIQVLAKLVRPGGRLSVAHGMSRDRINHCHQGAAQGVSLGLMEAGELARLFAPYFQVDTQISNEEMYQVCGIRRA